MNAADLSAGTATGDIYYDDDFDPENQEEQMDALIKQMERWYEWPEKKAKQCQTKFLPRNRLTVIS